MISTGLSESELRQRADGWRMSDRGIRVGNGWMVWMEDPDGHLHCKLISDPTDEPEKWPGTSNPAPQTNQLALLL